MATPTTKFYALKGGRDETDGKWYFGRVRMFFNTMFTYMSKYNINYDINLDVLTIKTCFERLQFKVDDPILNRTAAEMIHSFNEDIDYFGCVVIFVFSHGEEHYIYGTDYDGNSKGKVNVWHDYYTCFSGAKKPLMQKCPKIFVNEFCQTSGNAKAAEMPKKSSSSFHNTSHWLIYNAAQPKYDAYFNVDEGSFSTQSFCRRLNECAQTKDLEDIFLLVKEDDSGKEIRCSNYMQPIIYSTLLKKLYLLPEDKVYQILSVYGKKFKHLNVLGFGQFGVVLKAQNIEDRMEYAVKRIQLRENTVSEQKKIQNEVQTLAKLSKCPQIVHYHCVWYESAEFDCQYKQDLKHEINGLSRTGPTVHMCYIQMELCGATLEKWLMEKSSRNKLESLSIFKQIVQGLGFIHRESLVHRDVKPSNILFALNPKADDLCVRIADFGLTKNQGNFTTFCGTFLYMAPEILSNTCESKSDMYSAGLILIELLYNCSGEDHDNILNKAKVGHFPEAFQNELQYSVPTLKKLLSYNAEERPSSGDMLKTLFNDPDWNEDLKLTNCTPNKQQKQDTFQLTSQCTSEEHLVEEVNQSITTANLQWDGVEGVSGWYYLHNLLDTKIRWMVCFYHFSNGDFAIKVRCQSPSNHFFAASFRLFAVVEECPQVWTEVADYIKSTEESRWRAFSKKISDLLNVAPIRLYVRLQWKELHLPPVPHHFWDNNTAHIVCRWQLRGWKSVIPTSCCWGLVSQPFEQCGASWRIIVLNRKSGNDRKLLVMVNLQHIPLCAMWSKLSMNCSILLWEKRFDEMKTEMKERCCCWWTVLDDLNSEPRDPLDLKVAIRIDCEQ